MAIPEPPASTAAESDILLGRQLYYERCVSCHGQGAVSGGLVPDLRLSPAEVHLAWDAIVRGGALRDKGMPSFAPILDQQQSEAVQAFVIDQARRARVRQSR